jgi:hypothetical protein
MHFRGVNLTPPPPSLHPRGQTFCVAEKTYPRVLLKNFTADIFLVSTDLEELGDLSSSPLLTSDADAFLDSLGKKDFIGKK